MKTSDTRAVLALQGILVVSTLAMATIHRPTLAVVALLSVVATLLFLKSRRTFGSRPLLLLWLGGLWCATAIQLIPLPSALLRVLAPGRYDLATANAKTYASSVASFIPISQDLSATFSELVKFSAYLAIAYLCLRVSRSQRNTRRLLKTIVVVGSVVAACALMHRLLGMQSVLGLYTPQIVYTQAISPFLNPNHLAGYLSFVALVGLGLSLEKKGAPWALLSLFCIGVSVQAESRGALLGLLLGLLCLAVLRLRQGKAGEKATYLAIGGALVLALAFGFFARAQVAEQLLGTSLQEEVEAGKFVAWKEAPALLSGVSLTGVGRGAFEASFRKVAPPTGDSFSHVENQYLQTLIDWGVLAGFAALFFLALMAYRIVLRRTLSPAECGGVAAIFCVAVQSIVDFGLELPGFAIPVLCVFSLLQPRRLQEIKKDKQKKIRLIRLALATQLAIVATLVLLVPNLETRIAQADLSTADSTEQVLSRLDSIATWHPASYQVPASGATEFWQRRDASAFRLLGRAMSANPNHWALHFLEAQMLQETQNPRQSYGAYQRALASPGVPETVFLGLLALKPQTKELLAATPRGKGSLRMAVFLLREKRAPAAIAVIERELQEGGSSPALLNLGISAAIQLKDPKRELEWSKILFTKTDNFASLQKYLNALHRSDLGLYAYDIAIEFSETHPQKPTEEAQLQLQLAKLERELGRFDDAFARCEKVMRNHQSPLATRKQAHLCLATIENKRGNQHQADWHRAQAQTLIDR